MPHLFEPFTLRGVTLRNRIGVSPMCQYSSEDGFANDWHLVHLGSRAVGGAGLIIVEATAVEARGRISPQDVGIWSDAHVEPLARVAHFVAAHGAAPGIQLAHAGRKASTYRAFPGEMGRGAVPHDEGGWEVVAPSPLAFDDSYPHPRELTHADIAEIQNAFAAAAARAKNAGFTWLELHAAHGYLLHTFHSPLSNQRTDDYGGTFENRVRFTLETTRCVKAAWGDDLPLTVRISASDWADGGWTLDESVELARRLKAEGVDLIDCSSGGLTTAQQIPVSAGYQVPFSERIRHEAGIATAAVGLITEPEQADAIIRAGQADVVLLARAMLRDPYWALHAAQTLGAPLDGLYPPQYHRGFPRSR
jgi:2,4-dienoyl-CoA reductase-like NADH-dependent reductase (Old Yellow Enzyme family)